MVKFCLPFTDLKALYFINSVPCVCQSEDNHLLQAHLRAYVAYWQLMKNPSLISHPLPSRKTQHKGIRWMWCCSVLTPSLRKHIKNRPSFPDLFHTSYWLCFRGSLFPVTWKKKLSVGHFWPLETLGKVEKSALFKRKHVPSHFYFQELLKYSTSCDGVQELQEALVAMLDLLKSVNDSMHQISITGYDVSRFEQWEPLHKAGWCTGNGWCPECVSWELSQNSYWVNGIREPSQVTVFHLISGVWDIPRAARCPHLPPCGFLEYFSSVHLCVLMADLTIHPGCPRSISHSAFTRLLSEADVDPLPLEWLSLLWLQGRVRLSKLLIPVLASLRLPASDTSVQAQISSALSHWSSQSPWRAPP